MICKIRNALFKESTEKLIHAFVTSQLDNGNALLYGIKEKSFQKLQRVLGTAARIIYKKRKYDHVTHLLMELHWLPVKKMTDYKILLMAYKAQHGLAPDYI